MNVEPIGTVRRISEGESVVEILPEHVEGLHGLVCGDRLEILYWMHDLPPEQRRAMRVHPRGDRNLPRKGVFNLRSPMRPNPIGVTVVELVRVDGRTLRVRGLDALDGSPVIDIKAARSSSEIRRVLELWGKIHDVVCYVLAEGVGEERLEDVLHAPLFEAGRDAAGKQRRDAAHTGREIMGLESLWGIEGRVLEEGPDEFVREVTKCPWSFFAPISCKVLGWWMEGYCRGLNDRYTYTLEQLAPEGADSCIWAIRKRNSGR